MHSYCTHTHSALINALLVYAVNLKSDQEDNIYQVHAYLLSTLKIASGAVQVTVCFSRPSGWAFTAGTAPSDWTC